MIAGILIAWFILCVLVGFLARKKGRSGLGFFVIAFLFSPLIGFIATLIANEDVGVLEAKQLRAGGSKRCIFCAEVVKVEASVCRYCGKDIPSTDDKNVTENSTQIEPEEIHRAVANGRFLEVCRLVKEGGDVNSLNADGDTPLNIAQNLGDAQLIKYLKSKGATL